MSLYFCDTSAIIKRYVEEPGHQWISQLCDPANGHDITISQVALVEVVAVENPNFHP
jgi:predicted nucleic acid-binding protein